MWWHVTLKLTVSLLNYIKMSPTRPRTKQLYSILNSRLNSSIYPNNRNDVLNFHLIGCMVSEAGLFNFFNLHSFFIYIYLFIHFWIRLTWLCLDWFEGSGVTAEMQILSRFLLMTSSFLFACSRSFWWLQCTTVPIWSSFWFEFN